LDSAKRLTLDRADLAGLPDEIVLRLFGRAIAEIGGSKALRLGRLEDLVALTMACGSGRCVRRTLGNTLVSADSERVVFEPAPPRRSSRNRPISSGSG
jgi:hypothetical protein